MHKLSFLWVFFLLLVISTPAQDLPPRDARAVAVLQQSVAAMGGVAPSDSVARGTATITAGSTTETAAITILTRGTDQTAEHLTRDARTQRFVYSRGHGYDSNAAKPISLERALILQSTQFPLPLIVGTLNDPESAAEYVGLEKLNGTSVHHIRFWKTYAGKPKLRVLADLSKKDLWVDALTSLPVKLGYEHRTSRGPGSVGVPVEVLYSDYRNVGGFLYPLTVKKALSNTPWVTTTIQTVVFNTGLTDADFSVRQ